MSSIMSTDRKERLFFLSSAQRIQKYQQEEKKLKKRNFTVNCVKIIQGNVYLLLKQLNQSVTPFIYITSSNPCLQKLTFQTTISSDMSYQNNSGQRNRTLLLLDIILSLKMHISIIYSFRERDFLFGHIDLGG